MSDKRYKMHGGAKLEADSDERLRGYYEEKYRRGGYSDGFVLHGVPISDIYHDRRQALALRMVAPAKADRIIDAGCGNGVVAKVLAPQCMRVQAVDLAANAFPDWASVPNVVFQQGNIQSLPFDSATADKVVCVETLEHVREPDTALSEFRRVLRPQGKLILTYPTINTTYVKRLHLAPRHQISEHLNEWPLDQLLFNLSIAGFLVKEVHGIAFDLGPIAGLKRLGGWWARSLTDLALAMPWIPGNSLFVAITAETL